MTKNESLHPRDIKEVILGDHELSIDEVVAVARYSAAAGSKHHAG
jgi:histidine ammonia-lyase